MSHYKILQENTKNWNLEHDTQVILIYKPYFIIISRLSELSKP